MPGQIVDDYRNELDILEVERDVDGKSQKSKPR